MNRSRCAILLTLVAALALMLVLAPGVAGAKRSKTKDQKVLLGAKLYFDADLSEPSGQACADCHQPFAGYADPAQDLPVSEGVIPGRFGGLNAPSAAYMPWSPVLHQDADGVWTGGAFWNGRASGWTDGKPLVEQAKGPFLNPGEMNNSGESEVVRDVRKSSYAGLFQIVYGKAAFNDADAAYHSVADAIAAFESSSKVNTFSSRFDAFAAGDEFALSEQEKLGLDLYEGKALCSQCHPSTPGDYSTGQAAGKALFTDYTYDNLGLPYNTAFAEPPLSFDFVPDVGLGGFLREAGKGEDVAAAADGAFKVPTLRNIGKTAPYGHNGYFATLQDIVHFYNTRDVDAAAWPAPDVPQNVNMEELGDLGLTPDEEAAIVAFLLTLDDQAEFDPSGL